MKMKHISLLWVAALLMFGAFAFHAFIREDGRQEPQYEERSERFQESASWTTIPDSVIELCMPAPLKKTPEIILRKKSYVVSYNQDTRMPNWVAWQLTAEHTDGELKRMNNFHEEENCPRPRATLQDYKGSGWSRGHMCPAGDNKWSRDAMYDSFSLVNVCPQDSKLNSGVWNRVLMKRQHETIGPNKVVVPEAFFKVVLCMVGKPKAFGVVVRNNEGTKKRDLYYNSVDDVERLTGLDFFPSLPDDIEKVVEAEVNMDEWR